MPDSQNRADAEVPRRSFLGGAVGAVAGVTLTAAGAACQRPRPVKGASESEVAKELDTFIGGLAAEATFSVSALVAKDGRAIFRKAYGAANKEFNVPNQVSTKFDVASAGKMFTGVAVAQLAEQGRRSPSWCDLR